MRVLERRVLSANRVGQFVSVVLEYAVVLERKDRRVGEGAMVVIMANDQGSVVVVPVVLCCVVLCCASRREYKSVERESVCVSCVRVGSCVREKRQTD